MPLNIITADQRLAERGAPKILIAGPTGIGKTSLLQTVDPETTLFVDLEAGELAVQDVAVDIVRPRTWPECRDLACYLGGPNLSLKADIAYSEAHYEHCVETYGDASGLDKYDLYFIDSITVAARLCMAWCIQQPDATASNGNQDTRAVYGMLGREMLAWLTQLQHARDKAVVLVCILEKDKDDYGRVLWQLQIDGSKTGRELPGIVDEVLTMQLVPIGEEGSETLERRFVCRPENPESYPAKDRSGRLDMLEPADLGALLDKLTAKPAATRPVSEAA